MKTSKHIRNIAPSLMALAVLGTIGQAGAQQSDEVRQLTNPESSVSVGGASVSGDNADRAQFGLFNGMRKDRGYLLLDLDYLTRDNASGLWTYLTGRNLGLDGREFSAGMHKQGDWKVFGEYNEITRYSPFTVNTAMTGVGTTRPNIVNLATPGSGTDYDFRLQRKSVSAGFEKNIGRNLKFEASVKSEDKSGTRLWGRGYDCAAYVCGFPSNQTANQNLFLKNAILMIPEPIDSTIKQFEAKLAYHNERMSLVAGYYGSFYTNAHGSISPTVPNSLYGGNGTLVPSLYPALPGNISPNVTSLQGVLQSAMALPPDNQAHQFSLAGNYAFSRSTKATFKYSVTRMKQDEDFAGMGFSGAPAGFTNLGGKVDGVNAQIGLSSKLTRDLSVLANYTYLENEDKTPTALYNVAAKEVFPRTTPATYTNINQPGVLGATWLNNHTSKKDVTGKLEGTYRLPDGLRLTLGADYRERHRIVPESRAEESLGGLGPLREKNTETTYRIDLRRSMSETLNGSIGYSTGERRGSDWTVLSTLDPAQQPQPVSALNTFLINTYCGGRICYGQVLPANSVIQINANTPFPVSMADLDRQKWKATLDWTPTESLSVQFVAEEGKDKNVMTFDPVAGPKGWRDGNNDLYSLDATWAFAENWRLTGYASVGEQSFHLNHSTGSKNDVRYRTTASGMSLAGEATKQLLVGASVRFINETNRYGVEAATGTAGDRLTGLTVTQPSANNLAQAAIGLPEVVYRNRVVSLYGIYALNKKSDLRLDLVHHRSRYEDWVWGIPAAAFVFSDNTTIKQQVDQSVTFVGVTYAYRFR